MCNAVIGTLFCTSPVCVAETYTLPLAITAPPFMAQCANPPAAAHQAAVRAQGPTFEIHFTPVAPDAPQFHLIGGTICREPRYYYLEHQHQFASARFRVHHSLKYPG